MRSISAICPAGQYSNKWFWRWSLSCISFSLGIKFFFASNITLIVFLEAPLVDALVARQQQWLSINGLPLSSNMPLFAENQRQHNHDHGGSSGNKLQPQATANNRLIGAQEQQIASNQVQLIRPPRQTQELFGGQQQAAGSSISMSPNAENNYKSEQRQPDATTGNSNGAVSADNTDGRLAQFLKTNLLPKEPTENSRAEHKRFEALAGDLAKVYRVLAFTGKVAHKLHNAATQSSSSDQEAAESGGSNVVAVRSAQTQSEVPLAAAASSGLMETIRRNSGRMLVNRLAKKTDWNALFVKLAKVFLQYFLDLILNDMFGTTGRCR